MKKFGSKSGFTLVELIVVIAILGILAGVAVPAYSGYVKKAYNARVLSELSGVVTASQAAAAEKLGTVDQISVTSEGAVSVTCNEASISVSAADLNKFMPDIQTSGSLVSTYKTDLASSEYADKTLYWTPETQKWSDTAPSTRG